MLCCTTYSVGGILRARPGSPEESSFCCHVELTPNLIRSRSRNYQPPREAIRYGSAHCVSRNCSSRKRRSRPERSKQTNQPLPSRGEPTTWPTSPLGVSTSMPNAMVVILLYQLPYGIQVIMMTKAVRAIVASICSGDILSY